MRTIFYIIILLFFTLPVKAEIYEYLDECVKNESYKTFSEVIKGSATISDVEKQMIIDREIQQELNSTFIYMDLEDCINAALGENYNIKIQRQNKNMAYWQNKNSQFMLLPNIYYNFTIQNLGGQYLVGGIVTAMAHEVPIQSMVGLEWSTISQGRYFFQNIITRNALNAQKAQLEYTREETILRTVMAYYDALKNKMEIEVQKVNLYDRVEQLKYTKGRFDAGVGTLYDVKRAQAELAQAQQDYSETLFNLRVSQANLANIIGVDVFDAIYPFEYAVDKRTLIDKSFDLEQLYNHALVSREDLRAKQAEVKVYRAMRNMNYADIIPDITVSYQNGYVGTVRAGLGNHNSISLSVRTYLGQNLLMGTITQIKADTAALQVKKLELQNLERTVKENIINAYYSSENALKKIEESQRETEAANVSFDLSLSSMKTGQATFIDVIESQNIKVRANINLISNMIEYNKAQSQLLFEIGLISPENVLKDYIKKY